MIKLCRKWYVWQSVVIFLLCTFCYSNSLSNGFMMDDYVLLPAVKSLKWGAILTSCLNGFYRPVGAGLIKLIYSLLGSNSIGYHIVNLFLFFIICMLFLFIARWLFINSATYFPSENSLVRGGWGAFISVLFYCVHPINNMIVNYKTASMLAISVICMQISFMTFLIYIENRKKICYSLSIFFYFCSIFSHEICSILPIYLFMAAYYLRGQRTKGVLSLFWPYLLCFIFCTSIVLHFSCRLIWWWGIFKIPFGIYLVTLSKLFQWYIFKLFFPHDLLFVWDVPITGDHMLVRYAWLIFFIGFLAGVYFLFTKLRKLFEIFCLTFFVVGFIPICIAAFTYVALLHTAFIEPHWFYFSSLGIFMLWANFIIFLGRSWNPWPRAIMLCGLILILVIMTRQSNTVWKNNETYCKYWIKLNHYNAVPSEYLRMETTPKGF